MNDHVSPSRNRCLKDHLTRNPQIETTIMMTFKKGLSLTRSLLTNLQTRTAPMTTSEEDLSLTRSLLTNLQT